MINITKPYKDDMILPVCVYERNGEVSADCYRKYLTITKKYIKKYKDDLFSDAALLYLDSAVKKKIKGYSRYDEYNEYYLLYTLFDCSTLPKEDCVRCDFITDAKFTRDLTDFEVDEIIKNRQPAFVVVEDDKIVAICAANYFIEDDEKEVELAVETAQAYRGRGYATALLTKMSRYILEMGKTPVYRVSRFNSASIATVEKCGYKCIGKEFYYNCYNGYS